VVEEDKDGTRRVLPNRCGTPQGGVISPLLANVYLNPLDHGVNQKCVGKARMVRYADDFVIMCRPGQAQEVLQRTAKWLTAKGLKLNESKTRLVDIRREGINFLGFNLTWRKSLKHHGICMWNPVRKAAKLCAWDTWAKSSTTGRYGNPSAKWSRKPIRCCEAGGGYFHYRNSTSVMSGLQRYNRERLRRWIWRKHDCKRGLWNSCSD